MDLSYLDAQYETAEKPKDSGGNLPDGTYPATIEQASIGESQNGTPRLSLRCIVTGNDHAGRVIFFDIYLTDKTMPFVKRDLSVLKWPGKVSELADNTKREHFLDLSVELNLSTKGDRQNVYLRKLLSAPDKRRVVRQRPESQPESQPEAIGAEDEPPF
jgi:hypothetical protein